ncbi:hypothetical protein VNI00_002466 [Paramarasmius palmivorus]|uniref:N-acetyltransferase domain-containing protein n=1 Tax=Paramarasmius palmivorus TaxID=297713 RepID=A0AAW0DZK5_9AGAR
MYSTERLTLRAFQDSDIDHLLKLFNNASVMVTSSGDYLVPRGPKYRETLEKMVNDSTFFAIIETKEEKVSVGFTLLELLHRKHRGARYGLGLTPEFWGKGFGTEVTKFMVDYAFISMGVHRLALDVFSPNEAAVQVYKKSGFIEEGRHRKAIWYEGRWVDIILMSILEEEWAARRQERD